jgi:hypothetical protein
VRCAIYFVPPADDPLAKEAARWLRRDIYTGARINERIEGLTDDDHAFLTALPRRYGFHATLKAPFHLTEDRSIHQLERHLARFCDDWSPLSFRMKMQLVDSFFALVPVNPEPDLNMLAASIVTEFDAFRLPPREVELARHNVSRLNSRQLSNLLNWGYPYVFDQFRFHMTLTGAIDHLERDHVAQVIERHFGGLATGILDICQLVLAVEPEPNAPFIVHSTHRLSATSERRIA